jgi:thiamine biosynthesis lipoprotein
MMAAAHTFPALGTLAVVAVADPGALAAALEVVQAEVDACDAACSRFRRDSDLSRLNAGAGRFVEVSVRLLDDLDAALWAARLTDGLIDPTAGQALVSLGYDRDFAGLAGPAGAGGPSAAAALGWSPMITFASVPGWTTVSVDRPGRRARVPAGVQVDLGSTAKARSADLAARSVAEAVGCGVLVSLGGDVSVAGAGPAGGWSIRVTDDARAGVDVAGQMVAIQTGGLATSGTTVRSWKRAGRDVHHVIDPRTGLPAKVVWRTVSVAAGSCLDANVASTAAVVLGRDAPGWLSGHRLAARLVRPDGTAVRVGGWPADLTDGPLAKAVA